MQRTKKAINWTSIRVDKATLILVRAEAKKHNLSISEMVAFRFKPV